MSEHETAVILSAERVGNTSLSLRVDFDTSNGTATGKTKAFSQLPCYLSADMITVNLSGIVQ